MRHGFLLIDKPAGVTSHDVVAQVRRMLHERSVGHLGTLDPAATGLLVLAVGRKALKVVEMFSRLTKAYEADVRLGAVSTTYDGDGAIEEVVPPKGWTVPPQTTVQNLLRDRFLGRIKQVPPAHSAVHVGGERAYRKARQGRAVHIPARDVEISACNLLSYEYPRLRLHVACGSGTYIRSLAHDLGQMLRCGGYLERLRRTEVGEWPVSQAAAPADIAWARVLPLKDVLQGLPRRDLADEEWQEVQFGRDIEGEVQPHTIGWHGDIPVAVLEPGGEGIIHARKVL
ncbi:MAG: tRNA pseudouridine(55) synthase TruB [Candidatus Peribacteraceae bacterium]|nr:tRNA pseudouridine(55) synthase TruB [Candidatus Peribacteraceae bacterium]